MLRNALFLAALFLFACSSRSGKIKLEQSLSSFCKGSEETGRYINEAFDFIVLIESYAKLPDSIRRQLPMKLARRIEIRASEKEGYFLMLCNGEHVKYPLELQGLPCKISVSPMVKKNQTLLFMKSASTGTLNLGEAAYSKGKSCFDAAKYDSAIVFISRALELDSSRSSWYFLRGDAHKKLKQYDSAAGDFSRVIALDSTNIDAYFNRGDAYLNLGQYKESIQDLSRAIRGDPEHFVDAYYTRGAARKKMNDASGACDDYKKAKSLNPVLIKTYKNYCD